MIDFLAQPNYFDGGLLALYICASFESIYYLPGFLFDLFLKVHSGQIHYHVRENSFQSRYQNYIHVSSSEDYHNLLLNRTELVQLFPELRLYNEERV